MEQQINSTTMTTSGTVSKKKKDMEQNTLENQCEQTYKQAWLLNDVENDCWTMFNRKPMQFLKNRSYTGV